MSTHDNNYANGRLKETEFKTAYIATFLASYMAGRYARDCLEGHPRKPYEHQPVEDADFLANEAWKSIVEIMGPQ